MDILSVITGSLYIFITLVAKSFTKIMLMMLGVFIAFLAIPQSRVAAMLGVAIISAFAGGILIQIHSEQHLWTDAFSISVAFGCGFVVFPFLNFFRKFNELVNKDQEIVELLFNYVKSFFKSKLGVDKNKDSQ